jgi:hypothetical protein
LTSLSKFIRKKYGGAEREKRFVLKRFWCSKDLQR